MTTPQGFSLGDATGHVDINPSGVRTGLEEARRQLNRFRQDMGQWVTNTGRQVRNFGAVWTAAAAPIGLALGAGVSAAGDFDEALIEIQARAGLTGDAMNDIREKALQLGADTNFSSQQAADSFLQLMTAGLSLDEVMRQDAEGLTILDRVLDGAAASGADLGLTADQVTNIMSSFRLEVTDAAAIVDAMAQAAGSSPASMTEMGEALQAVGGDATSFGLSLDQTSAALAIMANNGIRGSEAATQLRSMFTAMSAPTDRASAAWAAAGTSLFDANGNARDFSVVLQELEDGLANMSAEERAETIQALAGSYGRVGLNALLASEGIDSMIETMDGQTSASEVAQQRMASFKGQLTSLQGSVESLMITAFTPFMNNVLRPIISLLIGVTNSVRTWASENEALTQMIVTMLAVFVGLGPVITIIGQAMMFAGGALAFFFSPLGLIIGGIGVLVFMLRDTLMPAIRSGMVGFSSFRDILGDTNDYIGAFVGAVASFIGNFLITLGMPIDAALKLRFAIEGAFEGMRVIIWNFKNDLASFGLGDAILSLFGRGQGSGGESTLEDLFFRMGFSREAAIQITNDIFNTFSLWFTRIRGIFTRVGNAILPAFRQISTFLSNNIGNIIQFGRALFGMGVNLMRMASPIRLVSGLLNFLGIDLLSVFEKAMDAVMLFFWGLNQGFSVIDALRVAFGRNNFILGLIDGFVSLSNFVTNTVIPTLQNFGSFFIGLWAAFQNSGWSGAATFIQDNLITPLVNGFNNINWGQVGTNILNALGTALTTAVTWATWINDNILSPLLTNAATAIAAVDWMQVGFGILNAIGAAIGLAFDFVVWLNNNFLSPLLTNAAAAIQGIDWFAVGEGVINAIGAALTATFDFIAWIINSIFNPITTNTDAATGQVDWGTVGTSILNAIGSFLSGIFDFALWLTTNVLLPLTLGAASAIQSTDWSAVGDGLMTAIANALPNIIQWVQDNIITPVTNALSNFDPMSSINTAGTSAGQIGQIASAVGSGEVGVGQVWNAIKANLPGFSVGSNFVSNDMVAQIHQGEAIIPAANNPFNPNASSPFTGGGGGDTFAIEVNIQAYPGMRTSDAERLGAAAGRGIKSKMHRKGSHS